MSFFSRYSALQNGGGGSAGVTTLNTLSGALTLAAGSNITITPSGGDTLTIASVDTGLNALAAVGSSPNANAATIAGTTLNLEPASASFPGVVTTGTQAFGGGKQFSSVGVNVAAPASRSLQVKAFADGSNGTLGLTSNNSTYTWSFDSRNNGFFSLIQEGFTFYPFTIDNTGKSAFGMLGSSGPMVEIARASDIVQLGINAHSTQTSSLIQLKNTSAAIASKVDGSCNFYMNRAIAGTTSAFTNASAGLELQSTTLALLLSRMNTTQESALTAANGMIIYNSQTNKFRAYENGAWTDVIAGASGANTTLSNLGTTAINADLIFNKSAPIIQTADAAGNTQTLRITSGTSSGGTSGGLELRTANTTGSNSSGQFDLYTGNTENVVSGPIYMFTGASTASNTGEMQLGSGGSDSGNSGQVYLLSGDVYGSAKNSGKVNIWSGYSDEGNSGDIELKTQDAPAGTQGKLILIANGIDASTSTGAIRWPNLSSDPSSPSNGMTWYNTTSHTFKGYQNGSVVTFTVT